MNPSKIKLAIAMAALAGIVFFSVTQLKPKKNMGHGQQESQFIRETTPSALSVLAHFFNDPSECTEGKVNETACNNETKSRQLQFENCQTKSGVTLNGVENFSHSADCELKTNGATRTATLNFTKIMSTGLSHQIQSAPHTDFRGQNFEGGWKLSNLDSASYKLSILGLQVLGKNANSQTANASIRSLVDLTLQNPKLPSFQVLSGSIEISHNLRQIVSEIEIQNPLGFEPAKCCYPTAGDMKVSLKGNSKTFKISFGAECGKVTLDSEPEMIDLYPCP